MAAEEVSEEEVSSLVMAAEGAFTELSSLDRSSDEERFAASVEELLEGETRLVCCQFTRRVNEANVEAATTLLDIALSSEFREYSKIFRTCPLCVGNFLIRLGTH